MSAQGSSIPFRSTQPPPERLYERGWRVLSVLFPLAVAVSVVHYTDNFLAYDRYPQSEDLPDPSAGLVLVSWFAFTAFGLAGYLAYRRKQIRVASVCLAVYAGSGLVGIGHYLVPGVWDLAWWRHLHISFDILCGIAVFAFAVWSARRLASPGAAGANG